MNLTNSETPLIDYYMTSLFVRHHADVFGVFYTLSKYTNVKYLSGCIIKLFYLLNKMWFKQSRMKHKITFARIINNFKIYTFWNKEKSKSYSRWQFCFWHFQIHTYLAIFLHAKFLFWFVLKVPQFWKKRDLRNCLLKMNGL